MNIRLNSSKGIGLIEVLIATVVIALGLLSLASMQGNFLSESGSNKAKSEAQSIAEKKIEEFRNVSTKDEFSALATGTDNVSGKNADFTRTWTLGSLNNPERKSISVDVTWDNEIITLESELAWNVVGNSSIYSSTGGNAGVSTSLPSPHSDAAKVESLDSDALAAATSTTDGYGFTIYRNADGKQIVADESYGGGIGRQLTCKHVCLTVKGAVYLENSSEFDTYEKIRDDDVTVCSWEVDVNGDEVTTSESISGTDFSKRNYACYYGGDCGSETAGTYEAAGCPANYADLESLNVRGGWRGNIGIIGFSNPTSKTLCFLGQVGGVTRRSYESTRVNGSEITQEGINTNYECHDFLMINNPSGSVTACNDYTLIPVSRINKELTGSYDVAINSISTDTSSCNATNYVIEGTIEGTNDERDVDNLLISLNSGIVCESGPASGAPSGRYLSYTCTIAGASGDVVAISAVSTVSTAVLSSSSITLGETTSISGPNITFISP